MQSGETLLLIDDEEEILSVTKMMLEASGFSVLTANGGRRGINLFRERQDEIKAVLIDLIMPDMGGKEVFHELKKIRSGVKAILISGYNNENVIHSLRNEGFSSLIFKPYDIEDLLEKLKTVING